MKLPILTIVVALILSCNQMNSLPNGGEKSGILGSKEKSDNKPKVSFTFDDGITNDIATYKFEDWNQMILAALKEQEIVSVFFVTGSNKRDNKGKYLLETWSAAGHFLANHTYTHPNFNNEKITVEDFEQELLATDTIIGTYQNHLKLFRFPYLKEGNTEEKIAGYRNILNKHGYRNGYVTIDASDWYVNSELIKCIQKEGANSPKVKKYKAFYVQHILERANYYEYLSHELVNRHIKHTLLLHHNLTSALFLKDLIQKFKDEGWEIENADDAFRDDFFNQNPNIVPAGESLVWSVAKASGKYDSVLRYPAEDSRYEIPKMKNFGL